MLVKGKRNAQGPLGADSHRVAIPKPAAKCQVGASPGSLEAALESLEKDHAFLTDSGVFTEDFIQNWITYKLDNEVNPMRLRPHPYEFSLYYDV